MEVGEPCEQQQETQMTKNATLRQLGGMVDQPAALADSTLVLIDCQNTYTQGVLELHGVQPALDQAAELLERARSARIPIVHVMHDDGEGSLYDIRDKIGQIVDRVAPREGELVIVKTFPNAFTGTDLHERLSTAPGRDLILAGFMTHMCVSSTARGAFSLGYRPAVVAGATATRALPDPWGERVSAAALQSASLAGISDLFGIVVPTASVIPD
jgi:nicotinamidase-related amidase